MSAEPNVSLPNEGGAGKSLGFQSLKSYRSKPLGSFRQYRNLLELTGVSTASFSEGRILLAMLCSHGALSVLKHYEHVTAASDESDQGRARLQRSPDRRHGRLRLHVYIAHGE